MDRLTVITAQDAAERLEYPCILRLAAAACLDGPDAEDKVKSTRTIHVYPTDDKVHADFRRLAGKSVRVRGNPFPQISAHHHALIVMEVMEIEAR